MIATQTSTQYGSLVDFLNTQGTPATPNDLYNRVGQAHAMLVQLVNDEDSGFSIQACLNLPRFDYTHPLDVVAWTLRVGKWFDSLYAHEREKVREARFCWE